MHNQIDKFFLESNKHTRVIVSVAALGLVLFLVAAALLPFKDQLFNLLYPKPSSKATGEVTFPNTISPNALVAQWWTKTILPTSDGVFLGGDLTMVYPNTGHGVSLEATSGARINPYPHVTGIIKTVIPDGSNGWYIGGTFTKVSDKSINLVAHILANGTVDNSFDSPIPLDDEVYAGTNYVSALALSPDKSTLYVGGKFGSAGEQARGLLAAAEATSGAVLSFNPNITTTNTVGLPSVNTLKISADGTTLYAGGSFTHVGGQARNYLAAINTSSEEPTAWNPAPDSNVYAMVFSSDSLTLYVSGAFQNADGQARGRVAAFDTTSGNLTAFNPNVADRGVGTIALTHDNNTLYIGGNFTSVGGQLRSRIASINTTDSSVTAFNPGADASVQALFLNSDSSTLYVGGGFNTIENTARYNIASFDTANGTLNSWHPKATGTVNSFAFNQNQSVIYVGGEFEGIGEGVAMVNDLVKLTRNGSAMDPNFVPPVILDDSVFTLTMAPNGSSLYVGGAFYEVNGQTRNNLASVDPNTGALQSFNPNVDADSSVRTSTISADGRILYVGGDFTTVGGQTRNSLAAINTADGTVASFNPSVTGNLYQFVYDTVLSPDGTILYISGHFTTVGGQTRNNIAAIETATGNVVSTFDPNANGDVNTLALSSDGSILYAGGDFSTIGGQTRRYLAVVYTASGSATPLDADIRVDTNTLNRDISSIVLSPDNSTLYIFGGISSVGGLTRNRAAAINTLTGVPTSWNPTDVFPQYGSSFDFIAISPLGYNLYVGGCFDNHFFTFDSPDEPTLTPTPTPTPTPAPTSPPQGGGGGGGGSGGGSSSGGGGGQGSPAFTPVIPQAPPKTGHSP